jgi:hypothetical protein
MTEASLRWKAPIFVIGSPRSGTTLLRLMLTSHPAIVIPPECGFILWLQPRFGEWCTDASAEAEQRSAFLDALFGCRKFDTWDMDRGALDERIASSKPATYARLCACVVEVFACRFRKRSALWGDKNNFHVAHIAELADIYPDASFLHIVRDVRDVACSYRKVMATPSNSPYRPNLPTGATEIASEWVRNVRCAMDALDRLPNRRRTLRYEDLVADASSELRAICDWLGIAYDEEMVRFHEINLRRGLEPEGTIGWKALTREPVTAGRVGQYRHILEPGETAMLLALAGKEMERFGYALH